MNLKLLAQVVSPILKAHGDQTTPVQRSRRALDILHEDKLRTIDGVYDERTKVMEKLIRAKLNPNERKKIISKKHGTCTYNSLT